MVVTTVAAAEVTRHVRQWASRCRRPPFLTPRHLGPRRHQHARRYRRRRRLAEARCGL